MTTVPDDIRQRFLDVLDRQTLHARVLHDPLPLGRMLRLEAERYSSESAKVRVELDDRGVPYLDYYIVKEYGRDEIGIHGRILADGSIEGLENQRDYQLGSETPEEFRAHNRRVIEILAKKGFI